MDARQIKQMIGNALASVRQALRGNLIRANGARQVIILQMDGVSGESFNAAELFQQPGLRSIPLAGMQPIIVPLNGNSANGVVVAMSNGALFVADLQPGEVALFNENDGVANSLVLKNGKVAELTTQTFTVNAQVINFNAPTVNMSGDVNVEQTLAAAVDVSAAGKSLKGHRHPGGTVGPGLSDPPQ